MHHLNQVLVCRPSGLPTVEHGCQLPLSVRCSLFTHSTVSRHSGTYNVGTTPPCTVHPKAAQRTRRSAAGVAREGYRPPTVEAETASRHDRSTREPGSCTAQSGSGAASWTRQELPFALGSLTAVGVEPIGVTSSPKTPSCFSGPLCSA